MAPQTTSYFPLQALPRAPVVTPEDPYTRTESPTHYIRHPNTNFSGDASEPPKRPVPIKRYSGAWFSHRWDREIMRGFLPRIIYVVVGFTIMGIWIGVIFLFANREAKHREANAGRDIGTLSKGGDNVTDLSYLKATLRKFDASARSLTVQWSAVYLDPDSVGSSTLEFKEAENSTTWALGFYRDVRSVYDANTTALFNDGFEYYMLDNLTAPRLGVLGTHTWDAVDTDIDMSATVPGDIWKEPLFGYPWDEWKGEIVTVMNNLDFSNELNASGLVAFPMDGVTVAGTLLNWKIEGSSKITESCINRTVPVEQKTCELTVTFTARRPGIVIFCVIVVVIVNWLSTIAIFLVTGEAVLLRRAHILDGTDILGVCFSALFALPTVRSLLPGAPQDFGAVIDFIGILPNVIIISICTMIFSAARLNMRMQMHFESAEKR